MNETALAVREALWVTLQIGGPLLVLMLLIGLVVAVLQALTQINEATLAFLTNGRVLAWQVGTARLYRVSELTGLSQDERVAASWAWRTLA